MKLIKKGVRKSPGAILTVLLCAFLCPVASAATQPVATITGLNLPGAVSLTVNGLNAGGQVTGYWYDGAGNQKAFLSTNGVLFDLGTLGGNTSVGIALNDAGQVTGYSSLAGEIKFHAFLFTKGTMIDLGLLGGTTSVGLALNDAGQVTGYSYLYQWNLIRHAFLYSGGSMYDLRTLGGSSSQGFAINRLGQVAGESDLPGDAQTHAFLFDGTALVDLGTFGGTYSSPNALNNLGQVTGSAFTSNNAETHAFFYNGKSLVDLGTFGGTYSEGFAINDLGQVAGDSTFAGEDLYHGFFSDGIKLQDLGTLGGAFSGVWAMNNLGQVVGSSTDVAANQRAFLWQSGQMTDLNSLLPANSGWFLDTAWFINDAGQIVGTGSYRGQSAWFFMTVKSHSNSPPLAEAGPDQTVECAGVKTSVTLDGSASSDPDGDALSFEWRMGNTLLATGARLALSVSCGTYTFTLRVTDSNGASTDDTVNVQVVDTTPPVVICPADVRMAAGANCMASVPDFLANLQASDLCSSQALLTKSQIPAPGSPVSLGSYPITITVADASGNSTTCTPTFTVIDATPPVISSVTASPALLTQINRQMVPITITVAATDNCDAAPVSRIISVTSSDTVTTKASNTAPDWQITGPLSLELRAETTSKDVPRIYTITVACTDVAGNTTTGMVTVTAQKHGGNTVVPTTHPAPQKPEHRVIQTIKPK